MDEDELNAGVRGLLRPAVAEEDFEREVRSVRESLMRRRRSLSDDEDERAQRPRLDEPLEQWEPVAVRSDLEVAAEADERRELARWAGLDLHQPVTPDMMCVDRWPGVEVPEAFWLDDVSFWRTASAMAPDDPAFARFRREHWRRHDRDFCWACKIKLTVEQTKAIPAYKKLVDMMTSGFHEQSFDDLLGQISDLWHSEVRRLQPERGADPGTGLALPPHYWHVATIRRHMLEHAPSVALDIESTYKTIDALSRLMLPALMEREKTTRELRVKNSTVKLYLEVVKMKQASWKLVVMARNARH